jgi:hypothetical protein
VLWGVNRVVSLRLVVCVMGTVCSAVHTKGRPLFWWCGCDSACSYKCSSRSVVPSCDGGLCGPIPRTDCTSSHSSCKWTTMRWGHRPHEMHACLNTNLARQTRAVCLSWLGQILTKALHLTITKYGCDSTRERNKTYRALLRCTCATFGECLMNQHAPATNVSRSRREEARMSRTGSYHREDEFCL